MADSKSQGPLGDDRLSKTTARTDRDTADSERTEKDGTALTLAERRKLIESEWSQNVLPEPPVDPKWHFCWLSTTNSADPIYKRMQKGYRPVLASEYPGYSDRHVTEGEFEGCISCNEMLLFKIDRELYQDIMRYLHHTLPMQEEELLKANVKPQGEDSEGNKLGRVEGFDNLARKVANRTFS